MFKIYLIVSVSNLTLLLDLHEFNMGKTIRKASEETIQGQ